MSRYYHSSREIKLRKRSIKAAQDNNQNILSLEGESGGQKSSIQPTYHRPSEKIQK